MIGQLKDLLMGRDGKQILSLTLEGDFREEYDRLKDCDIKVDIKKYSRQRSLTANAYAWVLIDQIAERMRIPKSEVYRNAIREIGGVSEVLAIPEDRVQTFCRWWESKGLGWQTEIADSKLEKCVRVIVYCGSSEYDTEQMSRLIDLLIQDAESLGIPTLNDKEVKAIVNRWGESDVTKPVTA